MRWSCTELRRRPPSARWSRRPSEAFAFDPAAFETLLDVREGRLKAREMDPAKLLGPYLDAISTVIEAVDRLDK